MKRRILSLALALVLCLALLPTAALGVEEAQLPKLATPTNLEWGVYYTENGSKQIPGVSSFEITGTHQGKCDILVYNVNNPQTPVAKQTDEVISKEGKHSSAVPFISYDLPDGTYFFTVQCKGDGITYADSEIAKSGQWTYTRGRNKLNQMEAPSWVEEPAQWVYNMPTYTWAPLNDQYVGGYLLQVWFSSEETSDISRMIEMHAMVIFGEDDDPKCSKWFFDELDTFGTGYYYVRVRALGKDITTCYNSDWSPFSTPYHYEDGEGGATPGDLPKLTTPTDLQWGRNWVYPEGQVDHPGYISWVVNGDCQDKFNIIIYRKNDSGTDEVWTNSHADMSHHGDWDTDGRYYEPGLSEFDAEREVPSGDYYFTIQALGDGVNYTDSDIGTSEIWSYARPTQSLPTPEAPHWDAEKKELIFSPLADESYVWNYGVEWYRAEREGDAPASVHYFEGAVDNSFPMTEYNLQEYGAGYRYGRVQATSRDITKYNHSAWSPLSEGLLFDKTPSQKVNAALDEIQSTATAEEIRQAVQDIGAENLSAALGTDDREIAEGVAARLAELETKTNITKTVEVDPGLGDTFDQSKVNFVGAALNELAPSATGVKLTVEPLAAETELVIPALYRDTVATKFSMDVSGVADSSALKVPVRITLPVPDNINPEFLVVLHYDSQGTATVIAPCVYEDHGKWMASFVVDHFSDFAMTEVRIPLSKSMFTVDTTDATYTGSAITKAITSDLVLGTDYTVSYSNNTNLGAAKITITGMGSYSGTLEYTFTIKSAGGGSGSGSGSGGGSGSGSGGGSTTPAKPAEPEKPTQPEVSITPASETFSDVEKGAWYEEGVSYVVSKGLFLGTAENQFSPDLNMTRGMLMTVLARLDGQDTEGGEKWYDKGMAWAKKAGISDGTLPEGNITREQLVTMLYRYAKSPETKGDLTAFSDAEKVSPWAADALKWAVETGILTGKGGKILDPQGTATRAEVAAVLQRFSEK